MASPAPDWHLFQAFLAVVHEGSLSGAARALGTTQPTMGRQVTALEAALGVTLFARTPDGFSPTEAGLRLVPSAEAMAAAVEAARRAASGKVGEEHGTVRITASVVVGAEVLPSILANFRRAHAGIAVELALSNRNDDMLRGDADIAIRMVRPTQGALVARQIGRIDVGFYAHRNYLESRKMPETLEDLRDHVLIGYDRNQAYMQAMTKAGLPLDRDRLGFRSDSDLAQLAALRAGIGIGFNQLGLARRDPHLIPVLHADFLFGMDVWLAMHGDLRGVRRVRLMFDHLAAAMKHYADTSRYDV